MEVKNIQIIHHEYKSLNPEYMDIIQKNKNLIPDLQKATIKFELYNTNPAFANALRRVFNDELDVKILDFDLRDIISNDKFILPDNIKERINLISLDQDIDDHLIFNLNIINNTNNIINIYTRDITIKGNTNKSDLVLFNKNIQICSLRPNKFINISNIKISKNKGYVNHVYSLGSFKYECINTDFNISSLVNELKDFKLSFTLNIGKNVNKIIDMIYNNLYFRFKYIQKEIHDYEINQNSEDLNKLNHDIYIIKNTKIINIKNNEESENIIDNLYEIHINKECYTVGKLISKYVYDEDNNIGLIHDKMIHPLSHKLIITIMHNDYKKIIYNAIDNILRDLLIFKSAFK